jgi:hypothetical protein
MVHGDIVLGRLDTVPSTHIHKRLQQILDSHVYKTFNES